MMTAKMKRRVWESKAEANNVPAQSKDAMGNKYNNNKEDDGANIIRNKGGAVRREAMEKNF